MAEHRRPKAAMRSPILIEPVHSFSYGHLRQRYMAPGRVRMTTTMTSHNMASILVNVCIVYIYTVWYCRSILWSIDSCQIRVSADQYHMTTSRAQVGIVELKCFFFLSWPLTWLWIFIGSRAQVFPHILRTSQTTGAPLLGLAKSVYYSNWSSKPSPNSFEAWYTIKEVHD